MEFSYVHYNDCTIYIKRICNPVTSKDVAFPRQNLDGMLYKMHVLSAMSMKLVRGTTYSNFSLIKTTTQ
jgi:hypothetical protein